MPDRAKIPRAIPRIYKTTYKQVCEAQNPDSIAYSAFRKLKKELKGFGLGGTELINQVVDRIEPKNQPSLFEKLPEYWDDNHAWLDRRAQQVMGDREFVELAANAARKVFIRLEEGETIPNVYLELNKVYILNIFEAHFTGRIPLQFSHHANADYQSIMQHISETIPLLEKEIEHYILGINEHQKINLLTVNLLDGSL
ncbi:MAG: hypothetical protein H6636_02485 [Anaerolineales bacterium]|nr:hypothetical protein [Anaerolineales bacterium]